MWGEGGRNGQSTWHLNWSHLGSHLSANPFMWLFRACTQIFIQLFCVWEKGIKLNFLFMVMPEVTRYITTVRILFSIEEKIFDDCCPQLIHSNVIFLLFKGIVARDFLPLVFSWIDTISAPDSHPKIFSNSVSNSQRYSYSKVNFCESALLDTALIPKQCCQIQC